MTEEQAKQQAERAKAAHEIPEGWSLVQIERRYVQSGGAKAEEPAPVRDLLAWVSRFSDGWKSMELTLEDATGKVIRVERSR